MMTTTASNGVVDAEFTGGTVATETPPPTQQIKSSALAVMQTDGFRLEPTSFDEAWRIAQIVSKTDFAPKDFRGKPEACLIAMSYGAEIGLPALQALQGVAVINGRPSIFGDSAIGLVRARARVTIREWYEGSRYLEDGKTENDAYTAFCEVTRWYPGSDTPEVTLGEFSVGDAKLAKLWMKKGYNGGDTPWVTHWPRMLKFRARGYALRDAAADILKGLILAEEAQDYPTPGLPTATATVTAVESINTAPPDAPSPMDPRLARIEELFAALKTPTPKRDIELNACKGDLDKLIAKLEEQLKHEDERKNRRANQPPAQAPADVAAVVEASQKPQWAAPENDEGIDPEAHKALMASMNELGLADKKAKRLEWAAGYGVNVSSFEKASLTQSQGVFLLQRAREELELAGGDAKAPSEAAKPAPQPQLNLYTNHLDEKCPACMADPGDVHVQGCPEVYPSGA